jgi:Fe-S cluster biogenesis protein NfuA
VKEIKEILVSRVRPFVQDDGGDVQFVSFNEQSGILTLKMMGSCAGCPSTDSTLKNGILRMMNYYIGEIKDVVSADAKGEAPNK